MENYLNNTQDMGMDWNDTIENDGQAFITLEEGDYNFFVTGFERGRFPGSQKLPPCNKATITTLISTEKGDAMVKFDIILCRSLEWRISSFFRCIGQKKQGERLTMNWDKVLGSYGRAHFKPNKYIDKNGNERTVNVVDKFIDYNPDFFKDGVLFNFDEINEDDVLPF